MAHAAQARRTPVRRGNDDRLIAAVVTVCFHAVLGGMMYLAGEFIERPTPPEPPIEVEIVHRPAADKPKPKPAPPPPPEIQPEEVEPEKPAPAPVEPKRVERRVRRTTAPRPAAPTSAEPPAPGPNTNDDAPAPVISMPELGIGGQGPAVALGKPKSRYVGTGGTGTNTGGGGPDTSQGTGAPPPRPVSIAAIKKRARPLNPDLDTSKLYPDEARRLGIEGQVKVYLVVDETGKVARRRITKSLGHGLDEVAMNLAAKLRFEPAIDTEGRAVADKLEWTFTFVLPR